MKKSFLSYLGGKSRLANKIIPKIPKHNCYCEVFAGAAWLLFKKEPSEVEILNDINRDLVTLYRVVKHHLEEFIRYFKWAIISRDEFDRLLKEAPETLTDIQRAARFYYLLRTSYGSRVTKPSFGINTTRGSSLNLLRIEEDLSAAHIRLSRVYIENLSYQRLISKFDKQHTFFYIDPPYFGCEDDYGQGLFSRDDFGNLNEILKNIKGRFLLSINDRPEIREIFSDFNLEEVTTIYTISKIKRNKAKELFIMNF